MDAELLRAKSGVPTAKEKAHALLENPPKTLDPKILEILQRNADKKADVEPRQGELDF